MVHESTAPYIGIKPAISSRSNADLNTSLIDDYVQNGYDHVLISITNNQYREKSKQIFQRAKTQTELVVPSPSSSDVSIISGSHLSRTIGLLSSWIELESDDELISEFSRQVLINELQYAKYIGVKHLIIAPPKNLLKLSNYSKNIQHALSMTKSHNIVISISLPISEEFQSDSQSFDPLSTWDMWNSIRTSVNYDERLKVSLALTKNAVASAATERWFAEPVSCLLASSSIFMINNKGFPVLSKSNQSILTNFHFKRPIILLHGLEKVPKEVDPASYSHYLNYIISKNYTSLSKIDKFSLNHNDVLLPPLQPLHTNLDDFTYSIFEEDDVKYKTYGDAVYHALSDMSHLENINIAVVGAGRGGLVDVTYKAIQKLNLQKRCKLTAIEKNGSAIISLEKRNHESWNDLVEIINVDMREWSPRESYNIIVSELLGSFGCNELSPECLSSVEKYLDRSNGVFIPESYTSHIGPIFTPYLYKAVQTLKDPINFHKQYVVRLKQTCVCSTKFNEAWTFVHPMPKPDSLKRHVISTFKIRHKTVIHGFAGVFTAKLYKDITLSIKPDDHTQDLISWFPMFFPLDTPMYVTDDTELEISLSREKKDGKVWYVWSLETFVYFVAGGDSTNEYQVRVRTGVSKIHNFDGCGFAIDERIEK